MQTRLKRQPDFSQFLKVLRREGRPDYLPFFELFASPKFVAQRTETDFDNIPWGSEDYWRIYVDFWLGMGYDCIPMEVPFNFPLPTGYGGLSEGSETLVVIRDLEDFEKYLWPEESAPLDFGHFEIVARLIPDGIKIIGGGCGGPYEWLSMMMGTVGLSYALMDNPELVEMVAAKIGAMHISVDRQLASMDAVGAVRQGDDLGYKTATFLSPEDLRRLIFPTYKQMASEVHQAGKPFILHSCGNLREVYDELIDDCRIDAKHSFEDAIMPVAEFKRVYGNRVTALGGLDVDVICRGSEDEVRAYARKCIEECFDDGYWALGTGNSLTNYMPVDNYIAVLEEGLRVS